MKSYLLDSYAILCYLQDEGGADKVESILKDAQNGKVVLLANIINIGEVYYRIARIKTEEVADRILEKISLLPIKIIPCRNDLVLKAAKIKAHYPVAYADAFAIATAISLQAVILSRDPELDSVKGIVSVEWI